MQAADHAYGGVRGFWNDLTKAKVKRRWPNRKIARFLNLSFSILNDLLTPAQKKTYSEKQGRRRDNRSELVRMCPQT